MAEQQPRPILITEQAAASARSGTPFSATAPTGHRQLSYALSGD